jgi:hypothetical protein
VHRLEFPLAAGAIALTVANHRVGSYVLLLVALALLVQGVVLLFDIRGNAKEAITRHRLLRPWGQRSVLAWRVWGFSTVIVAGFLATVAVLGGYLAG